MSDPPFTFGIPLIARDAARDWGLVQALLRLTLRSLAAQTDGGYEVVIAGHDRPDVEGTVTFLRADWPAERVRPDNLDSGRKKFLIGEHVRRRRGGGYLMFVDADDWLDTRLVATVRARLPFSPRGPIGGVVACGHAIDLRNRRALSIPHADAFTGGFHELCGSSTVALVDPDAEEAVRRDPYAVLHEHYRWEECCRAHGLDSLRLDLVGAYVVNTTANHSTAQGPFAAWRRSFDARVARGRPLDAPLLARFGLGEDDLREVPTVPQPILS